MYDSSQLNLFESQSINPVTEIKRQLRLVMSESRSSRDEILDEMNDVAKRDGIKGSISKETLNSWTKDSDSSRLPSIPWLIIFCKVTGNASPIAAMVAPLGFRVIGVEDGKVLTWGHAELAKRRSIKEAKLALDVVELGLK